jgi:spermidine/putrescine transport system permease protein
MRRIEQLAKPLLAAHTAAVFLFLYAPIVVLVVFSFSASNLSSVWGGFTTDWYVRLANNSAMLAALGNTLTLAIVSTLIAGILGTLAALGVQRLPPRQRSALDAAFYLPVVTPDIVMGLSLLLTFVLVLKLPLSLGTMIIAHSVFNTAYVMVVVAARLRGFDRNYDEAAADLGASAWQTFWRVKFPFIWPGILGGGLLAFAISLDEFTIAFFVSSPKSQTLPIEIWTLVRRRTTPELNALASLMLLSSISLALIAALLQRKK